MPARIETACVILEAETDDGDGASAFLPIGGVPMIERLINRLVLAGVRQIILMTSVEWPALTAIADRARSRKLSTYVLTKPADLVDHIRADCPFLLFQNGVLPSDELVETLVERNDPAIYTRPAATTDDRHERIDLNDRWAGLAIMPGSLVHNLGELPEDWSLASALLRGAIQRSVERVTLDISPTSTQRADLLLSLEEARGYEKRFLKDYYDAKSRRFSGLMHWLGTRLSMFVLPYIWNGAISRQQLRLGLLLGGLTTVIFAVVAWILPALLCALATLVAREIYRDNARLTGGTEQDRIDQFTLILIVLASSIAAIASHGLTLAALSAGSLFPLTLAAGAHLRGENRPGGYQIDPATAILLIGAALIFGVSYLTAILTVSAAILAIALAPLIGEGVKANLTSKD